MDIFKISLCGGHVCKDFGKFQSSPVCVGPVLWYVKTLTISKFPCVCSVLETLTICEKNRCMDFCFCTGEIDFFRVKIPVRGIFLLFALKKTLTRMHMYLVQTSSYNVFENASLIC